MNKFSNIRTDMLANTLTIYFDNYMVTAYQQLCIWGKQICCSSLITNLCKNLGAVIIWIREVDEHKHCDSARGMLNLSYTSINFENMPQKIAYTFTMELDCCCNNIN